jgi:glutamate carboxypeptidase
VLAAVPAERDEVAMTTRMGRAWPGMDAEADTAGLLQAAAARLGRTIVGVPRGGASDASHFAQAIPMTVDGLGPRGGGAHTPHEFVLRDALRSRAEVALALAGEALALAG